MFLVVDAVCDSEVDSHNWNCDAGNGSFDFEYDQLVVHTLAEVFS